MASIILILPLLFIFAIVWLCLTSEHIEVENIDQEGCQEKGSTNVFVGNHNSLGLFSTAIELG